MINPSSIDLLSLPWLPLDEKSAFPQKPAIYFAIDSNGIVQYIGRSFNPKYRWASHHRYKDLRVIGEIKIAYLFVDTPELLPEIESALISWFDPPLNTKNKSAHDSEKTNYGKVITRLRSKAGLTQKEIANKLDITVQTISNWETGATVPQLDPKKTRELCNILRCSLDELVDGIEER